MQCKSVTSDNAFRWLSAPGPAALSVLLLNVCDGNLAQQLPHTGTKPRHVWLTTPDGAHLDEVICVRDGTRAIVTVHGGVANRAAFEEVLRAQGYYHDPALAFWPGAAQLHELLTRARGRLGAQCVLNAIFEDEPAHTPAPGVAFLFQPPRVQLWGPVNAGKSSLLNALCGRQLAAVADEPGLTRDVIEGQFEHRGFVMTVFDAPGELPNAEGPDADALALARQWRQRADLVLRLVPPDAEAPTPARDEWTIPSRVDEHANPQPNGVSINQPETLEALKDRLFQHFAKGLTPGPALSAALRSNAAALLTGPAAVITM